MADFKTKTARLYDSKVSVFERCEHEHQASSYAPDVLSLISRLEIESVLRVVPVTSSSRVLDIGAGGGRWTLALAGKVAAVTAIEPSALSRLLVARTAHLPNVTVVNAPFEDVELTEQFDLVVIYGTLMYVVHDEAALSFIRKASSALRPGGTLVMGEAMTRTYRCFADWRELAPEEFLHGAHLSCRYWEVLRPPNFYRQACRRNGLKKLREFESHAPVFGRSAAWSFFKSLGWPTITTYNRLCRGPYGRLKALLNMRRMRMMIWTRPIEQ